LIVGLKARPNLTGTASEAWLDQPVSPGMVLATGMSDVDGGETGMTGGRMTLGSQPPPGGLAKLYPEV
jgi:hypothetical protein